MTVEFTPWPKTPRLFRDAVITEKIDGTNAAVIIKAHPVGTHDGGLPEGATAVIHGGDIVGDEYVIAAQSRSRLITPQDDNFGFAKWVLDNAFGLARTLGEGTHFGEWWGSGIQRGYGLEKGDRRFSLFNTHRYAKLLPTEHETDTREPVPGLGIVPVLDTYTFDTQRVRDALWALEEHGSQAAPGFMRPEGVIVFHSAAGQVFKSLIENDDIPKGASA